MGESRWTISIDRDLTMSMKRRPDLSPLETFYDQWDISGSYEYHWNEDSNWRRGIGGQLHYSRITGARENNDSNRRMLGAGFNLKQYFSQWLFLSPAMIIGYARNHLNFGTGIPLPNQQSWNIKVKPTVGAEYCLSRYFCPALTFSYAFERDIGGSPAHSIQAWSLGLTISGSLEKAPAKEQSTHEFIDEGVDSEAFSPPARKSLEIRIVLSGPFGSTHLTEEQKAALNELAESLKARPNTILLIHGHSRVESQDHLNYQDANQLAEYIRNYLLSRNVTTDQVKVRSVPHQTVSPEGTLIHSYHGESIHGPNDFGCSKDSSQGEIDRCVTFEEISR